MHILGTVIITISYLFLLLSLVIPSLAAGFVPDSFLVGAGLIALYLLILVSGIGLRRGRPWAMPLYSVATLVGIPLLFFASDNAPAQQAFLVLTSYVLIPLLGLLLLLWLILPSAEEPPSSRTPTLE